jgi:ribosomal protein L32
VSASVPPNFSRERGKFFAQVNHRGTSKQCPNCGTQWDNNLSIRWHTCEECGYENNRDVAAAEVICSRGNEKYPRTEGNGNSLSSRSAGEEILGKWRGAGSLNCEVERAITIASAWCREYVTSIGNSNDLKSPSPQLWGRKNLKVPRNYRHSMNR